ncbi:hypothetical protein PCE1_003180 [Barthelona sp. PCE]
MNKNYLFEFFIFWACIVVVVSSQITSSCSSVIIVGDDARIQILEVSADECIIDFSKSTQQDVEVVVLNSDILNIKFIDSEAVSVRFVVKFSSIAITNDEYECIYLDSWGVQTSTISINATIELNQFTASESSIKMHKFEYSGMNKIFIAHPVEIWTPTNVLALHDILNVKLLGFNNLPMKLNTTRVNQLELIDTDYIQFFNCSVNHFVLDSVNCGFFDQKIPIDIESGGVVTVRAVDCPNSEIDIHLMQNFHLDKVELLESEVGFRIETRGAVSYVNNVTLFNSPIFSLDLDNMIIRLLDISHTNFVDTSGSVRFVNINSEKINDFSVYASSFIRCWFVFGDFNALMISNVELRDVIIERIHIQQYLFPLTDHTLFHNVSANFISALYLDKGGLLSNWNEVHIVSSHFRHVSFAFGATSMFYIDNSIIEYTHNLNQRKMRVFNSQFIGSSFTDCRFHMLESTVFRESVLQNTRVDSEFADVSFFNCTFTSPIEIFFPGSHRRILEALVFEECFAEGVAVLFTFIRDRHSPIFVDLSHITFIDNSFNSLIHFKPNYVDERDRLLLTAAQINNSFSDFIFILENKMPKITIRRSIINASEIFLSKVISTVYSGELKLSCSRIFTNRFYFSVLNKVNVTIYQDEMCDVDVDPEMVFMYWMRELSMGFISGDITLNVFSGVVFDKLLSTIQGEVVVNGHGYVAARFECHLLKWNMKSFFNADILVENLMVTQEHYDVHNVYCFGEQCPDQFRIVEVPTLKNFNVGLNPLRTKIVDGTEYDVIRIEAEGIDVIYREIQLFIHGKVFIFNNDGIAIDKKRVFFEFDIPKLSCGAIVNVYVVDAFSSLMSSNNLVKGMCCVFGETLINDVCTTCPIGYHQFKLYEGGVVPPCIKDPQTDMPFFWKMRITAGNRNLPPRTFLIEDKKSNQVTLFSASDFTDPDSVLPGLSGLRGSHASENLRTIMHYKGMNIDDHNGCAPMHFDTGCLKCVDEINGFSVVFNSFTGGCTCVLPFKSLILAFFTQFLVICGMFILYRQGGKFPWTRLGLVSEELLDYDVFEAIKLVKDFVMLILPSLLSFKRDLLFGATESYISRFVNAASYPFLIFGIFSKFINSNTLSVMINNVFVTIVCMLPVLLGFINRKRTGSNGKKSSYMMFSADLIALFLPFIVKDLFMLFPVTYVDYLTREPIKALHNASPFDLAEQISLLLRIVYIGVLLSCVLVMLIVFHKGIGLRMGLKDKYWFSFYLVMFFTAFSLYRPRYLILCLVLDALFIYVFEPFVLDLLNKLSMFLILSIIIVMATLSIGMNILIPIGGLTSIIYIYYVKLSKIHGSDEIPEERKMFLL